MTTTQPGEPQPDLTRRATFRHWSRIPIRYNDLDTLGHVNNTATSVYLEQTRCELIYPMIRPAYPRLDIVVARLLIDFRREVTFPGEVDVGTIVLAVGSKSFRLAHGLFKSGSDQCASTGEGVLVWFDLEKRTSIMPPADVRAALAALR